MATTTRSKTDQASEKKGLAQCPYAFKHTSTVNSPVNATSRVSRVLCIADPSSGRSWCWAAWAMKLASMSSATVDWKCTLWNTRRTRSWLRSKSDSLCAT